MSYYITKAIFNVKTKTAPTTKASVYLKEVLGDWNSQTITYNNAPALVLYLGEKLEGVILIEVEDGKISHFYAMRNPDKLGGVLVERSIQR